MKINKYNDIKNNPSQFWLTLKSHNYVYENEITP